MREALQQVAATRTLMELHPLVTSDRIVEGQFVGMRDTGCGNHISARSYPSGDVEIVSMQLGPDDSLRRGGGASRRNKEKHEMDVHTLDKSVQRARTQVRRKAMTICADRMLTLTFRDNVQEIDEAWSRFKYFNKLMRWKYGTRYQYIAVPEYQKRGAVHFHLAVAGYYHVKTVRMLWRRAVGKFEGNIDITSPREAGKNSWNPKRIANYLSKYLSKHDSVEFNRRRFASGGNIQPPAPMVGWLALGVPLISVLVDIAAKLTRKRIEKVWESEHYYTLTYVST